MIATNKEKTWTGFGMVVSSPDRQNQSCDLMEKPLEVSSKARRIEEWRHLRRSEFWIGDRAFLQGLLRPSDFAV
jgi:hypothetical protein